MKKLFAAMLALVVALGAFALAEDAMSYADFVAAEIDDEVTIEAYVQAHQGWWDNNGTGNVTIYAQDEEGGYFLNTISMGFAVNKNSKNLDLANEFMRFLVTTEELNRMAQAKRMVTPCANMSLDGVYAAFGQVDAGHIVNQSDLGLEDAPDVQVRRAGWQVSNGLMTVDQAVEAFGTLE